jgi:transcriptional regulator with XRE-family HTH domain
MPMGDGLEAGEDWPGYLRRMTSRPGWSVARLARESGVHRGTIFAYISGKKKGVTVATVRAIATALGDDPTNALRAAGSVTGEVDEEVELILAQPVDEDTKKAMLERLFQLRERDKQRRIEELTWLAEQAQRRPQGA